jgi:hypothetical protein
VELVFEARGDPEVSAAAAKGPEEVGLFLLANPQDLAAGGDELDGPQIIERQAMLPINQPSPPPRVSPAMPVVETTPPVTARPV